MARQIHMNPKYNITFGIIFVICGAARIAIAFFDSRPFRIMPLAIAVCGVLIGLVNLRVAAVKLAKARLNSQTSKSEAIQVE